MADPRDVKQAKHQGPWVEVNPNKELGFSKLPKEEGLQVGGLDYEDYKVYHMEDIHFSPDPKITRLNQEIVRRVNRIAAERVDYKEAVLSKGPSDDKLLAMENITNLKKQIVKLQRDVKSHGGVYFDIPDRFNDDVPE